MNQSSLGDQPARRGAGRALSLSVPQANISYSSSPFLTSFLIYCLYPGSGGVEHIWSIQESHFGQSEEPEVGGIWPEVRGKPQTISLLF